MANPTNISWTVRRAQEKYSAGDERLFEYCKRILCKILDIEYSQNLKFLRVETWKQRIVKQQKRTDLWVEVDMERNGRTEFHCVLIEDKVYSKIRNNQLKEYKSAFETKYGNTPNAYKHYVLITCIKHEDAKFDKQYSPAKKLGFKLFSVYDLHTSKLPTTSDLFNEFWIYL